MKVKATQTFKFAKNCRETVLFQKNEVVSLEQLNLSVSQIEYILKHCKVEKVVGSFVEPKKEIKLEKAVIETDMFVEKEEIVEDEAVEEVVEQPAHYAIENKDDLIKFAADNFSLRIDRRSSLETVRKLIDEHLEEVN